MRKTSKKKTSPRAAGGPSAASLREIPEFEFDAAPIVGRGPAGMRKVLEWGRAHGRPKKGTAAASTASRSVRLSDATWAELERRAKRRGVALNALLRDVLVKWLTKAA
jgi:hypothetical protein